jgi:hypothetical protein
MRKQTPLIVLIALLICFFAAGNLSQAQFSGGVGGGVASVNGCTTICTVQPGNFIGNFTVANLLAQKPCDGVTVPYGSVAYVTDLGGGANNAKCINNAWQHFTLGVPTTNSSTSGTVTVTPLVSAPIQQLTGTVILGSTLTMSISTTNLYPGYQLNVVGPPSILGSIVLTVLGTGVNLPILSGAKSAYVWNGTALVQIQ